MSEPNEKDERHGSPSPKPLESALQKLSEERPQMLQEIMAMGMTSVGSPLHHKMNAEHITQVLSLATVHDERQFKLAQQSQESESNLKFSTRRYFFACFVIVAILAGMILVLFRDKPTILVPAITGLGAFISGAAAGFGLGRKTSS